MTSLKATGPPDETKCEEDCPDDPEDAMGLPALGTRSRRQVVGLDVGAGAVRVAVVSLGSPRPVVEKLGQVALPPGAMSEGQVARPDVVTEALRQLRKGLGLRRPWVVLGCERLRTFVRDVELPWVPAKLRQQSLPLLAADLLPMPPEDAVVDFVELADTGADDGNRLMRGLLVATSAEAVTALVAVVVAAGFRVKQVDLSAFALVRSLAAGTGEDQPEALIDVGTGLTTVVIHSGGVPQFVRLLPMPQDLEIPRLVADIRSSLDYHAPAARDGSLARIGVSGGLADAEVLAELAEAVRIPVSVVSAFRNVDVGDVHLDEKQLRVMAATSAVCVGLALGEAA